MSIGPRRLLLAGLLGVGFARGAGLERTLANDTVNGPDARASNLVACAIDAGSTFDAGALTVVKQKPVWRFDGGPQSDAGATDFVSIRVSESVIVRFFQPIAVGQCDHPLVSVTAEGDHLVFTGVRAGSTLCGYWFHKSVSPQRLVAVEVLPREDEPPAQPKRPWWSP